MSDVQTLLTDLYGKLNPEKVASLDVAKIDSAYGGDYKSMIRDIYAKEAPDKVGALTDSVLDNIVSTYGIKKNEVSPVGVTDLSNNTGDPNAPDDFKNNVSKSVNILQGGVTPISVQSIQPQTYEFNGQSLNKEDFLKEVDNHKDETAIPQIKVKGDDATLKLAGEKLSKQTRESKGVFSDTWEGIKTTTKATVGALGTAAIEQLKAISMLNEGGMSWTDALPKSKTNPPLEEKDPVIDIEKWTAEGNKKPIDSWGYKGGGMIPFLGMALATAISKSPTVAKATAGLFGEMGFGEGIMKADEHAQTTGKPVNEAQRLGTGLLYTAAYSLPMASWMGKLLPTKFVGNAISGLMKQNPNIAGETAKAVWETYVSRNPEAKQQAFNYALKMGEGAIHSTAALTTMSAGKSLADTAILGEELKNPFSWETLGTGIIFGLVTKPFAIAGQSSFTKARRETQGFVDLGVNKEGNPFEIVKNNNGIFSGLSPDGKIIKIEKPELDDIIKNSVRVPIDAFNKSLKEAKGTGKLYEGAELDAERERVTKLADEISYQKGDKILSYEDKSGQYFVTDGDLNNPSAELTFVDAHGNTFKNKIPKDLITETDKKEVIESQVQRFVDANIKPESEVKSESDTNTPLKEESSLNIGEITDKQPLSEEPPIDTPSGIKEVETGEVIPKKVQSTSDQIADAFNKVADGAKNAGVFQTIERFNKGEEVIFKNPEAIKVAKSSEFYNTKEQADGSLKVLGIKNPDTGKWIGVSKYDIQSKEVFTENEQGGNGQSDKMSDKTETLYHGTKKDFEEFDESMLGNTDDGWYGKGFYFHSDPNRGGYGNIVKSAKVDLKNPINLPNSEAGKYLYDIIGEKAGLDKSFRKESPISIIKAIGSDKFTELAKELGYDGVIVNYLQGTKEVVAFTKNSIKELKTLTDGKDKTSLPEDKKETGKEKKQPKPNERLKMFQGGSENLATDVFVDPEIKKEYVSSPRRDTMTGKGQGVAVGAFPEALKKIGRVFEGKEVDLRGKSKQEIMDYADSLNELKLRNENKYGGKWATVTIAEGSFGKNKKDYAGMIIGKNRNGVTVIDSEGVEHNGKNFKEIDAPKPKISSKKPAENLDKSQEISNFTKSKVGKNDMKFEKKEVEDFAKTSKWKVSGDNTHTYFNINNDKQVRITKNRKTGVGSGYYTTLHSKTKDGVFGKAYEQNVFSSTLSEAKQEGGKMYFNEIRKDVKPIEKSESIDLKDVSTEELIKRNEKSRDFNEMEQITKELKSRESVKTEEVKTGNVSSSEIPNNPKEVKSEVISKEETTEITKPENNGSTSDKKDGSGDSQSGGKDLSGGTDGNKDGTSKAEKTIKESAQTLADAIRKGKIHKPDIFSTATPASLVWDGAVEVVARTIEAGGTVAQAIADGIAHIKKSEWYKNSDKKDEVEKAFAESMAESKQEIQVKHSVIDEMREKAGLSPIEKSEYKNGEQLVADAEKVIKDGFDIDGLTEELAKGERAATPLEHAILAVKFAPISDKFNTIDVSDPNFDKVLSSLGDISKADRLGGTQASYALKARQDVKIIADGSRADFFLTERDINKAPFTENQKKLLSKQFDELTQSRDAWKKKYEELQNKQEKQDAEDQFKEVRKSKKKLLSDADRSEKKQRLLSIIGNNVEYFASKMGVTQNFDSVSKPETKELKEAAVIISDLVTDSIRKGARTLEEAIWKVFSDLDGKVDKKFISESFSGKYNEPGKTMNEIQRKIYDLRQEAKLIDKLDALDNGEASQAEKRIAKRTEEIEKLKDQIKNHPATKNKEAQDKIDGAKKRIEEIKSGKTKNKSVSQTNQELDALRQEIKDLNKQKQDAVNLEKAKAKLEALNNGEQTKYEKKIIQRNRELTAIQKQIKEHDLTKLEAYKKRLITQTEKYQEDLKNGNFIKTKQFKPIVLDAEAKIIRDNYIKIKNEVTIRRIQEEYNQRNKYQRAKDKILEVLNIPRTLMSSGDMSSAILRQGLIATISHPMVARRAFVEMLKQSGDQKRFDRWFADVRESPLYQVSKESGLYIADPHDIRLVAKEEAFMNNLAEKIPIAGTVVKVSERAYVSFLNKMRWDLFSQRVAEFEANGRTIENSLELYKATGNYINNLTGRGKLGFMENAAPVLSTFLFAPRLIASRVNMLSGYPLWSTKVPREVKMMYLKDMGKFIGTGLTILMLFKLNGADVEDDPRSTDFGKIKIGNTRWDIWGGHGQYIRLVTQFWKGESKSIESGEIKQLNGEGAFGTNRGDVVTRFFRGKLAPLPAVSWDLITGKTLMGEDATISMELKKSLFPLIMGDVWDAYKDKGIGRALGVAIPANFGVGTQTFSDDAKYQAKYDKENEPKKEISLDEKFKNKEKLRAEKDKYQQWKNKKGY